MSVFKGAGVAIVTPMYEDETVNYDKLGEILDEQVARGTDAIIICGTTGEASTLSHEEHLDVIRYAVKKVNHRIPVVAGTGSNCTETAVYLSQEAEKAGADALLVVTPYYNKATQNGLKLHFSKIARVCKASDYSLQRAEPYRMQSAAGDDQHGLVEHVENIVGVKEASGNIHSCKPVSL